jgi:NADPH:quinone reductase-like Zn-dependent oxidoreductase
VKAVVYTEYGPPDFLQLKEVEQPVPKASEVPIKIHATTVTYGDWQARKVDTLTQRILNGFMRPRRNILGHELAGEIESVGNDVQRFRRGDQVFASAGFKGGLMPSTYVCPRTAWWQQNRRI